MSEIDILKQEIKEAKDQYDVLMAEKIAIDEMLLATIKEKLATRQQFILAVNAIQRLEAEVKELKAKLEEKSGEVIVGELVEEKAA